MQIILKARNEKGSLERWQMDMMPGDSAVVSDDIGPYVEVQFLRYPFWRFVRECVLGMRPTLRQRVRQVARRLAR